jgi:hypothetical protein
MKFFFIPFDDIRYCDLFYGCGSWKQTGGREKTEFENSVGSDVDRNVTARNRCNVLVSESSNFIATVS